jgi:hypothetical protein
MKKQRKAKGLRQFLNRDVNIGVRFLPLSPNHALNCFSPFRVKLVSDCQGWGRKSPLRVNLVVLTLGQPRPVFPQ